jgi:hypothetical protein
VSRVILNPHIKTLHQALDLTPDAVSSAAQAADSVYRAQEKQLFATEGASGGQPWKKLSPIYAERKRRLVEGAKAFNQELKRRRGSPRRVPAISTSILVLIGDMRTAFSTQSGGHVVEYFKSARGWLIQLGARGPRYFKLHADGGDKIPGRPPKRDPQQRTPAQDNELRGAVRRALIPHVVRALRLAISTVPRAA